MSEEAPPYRTKRKTKPPKLVLIGAYVPERVAKRLRGEAHREGRSVSRTVCRLLEARYA